MTDVQPAADLHVEQLHIIWRDTFIINEPPRNFLLRAADGMRRLPTYVADTFSDKRDQPEILQVIERVSRSVAPIGYTDLLRIQFSKLRMADLRPALDRFRRSPVRLTSDQVQLATKDADQKDQWLDVTPMLILHKAGVGVVEYHTAIDASEPGLTPEEAINLVRQGIQWQLLRLSPRWLEVLPPNPEEWNIPHLLPLEDGQHIAITGLRDLSGLIDGHVRAGITGSTSRLRRRQAISPDIPPARPTGSTSVVLLRTNPVAGDDLYGFVRENALALRGIGSMDRDWINRSSWLVERELTDNLSTDAELGMYLLGNSELLVFNHRLADAMTSNVRRLRLKNYSLAATYFYMHYLVLMSWIYLQDAILRAYIHRLDALAADTPPDRGAMVATLHSALADLIQYQENITPYATRIEFLERARAYHNLDKLAVRFERKQDLLLAYSSEYHDYREASAAEFLNWLAAILAGGELGNLVVNATGLEPSENPAVYLAVTIGSIALALGVMFMLRVMRRR